MCPHYPSLNREEKVLLFTPVSITPLIDTEDACFDLNASRPIAKGDLKWRDALLVAHRVNSNEKVSCVAVVSSVDSNNGMKGEDIVKSNKKGMSLIAKQRAAGWTFLTPATILIAVMSFYPMIRAFIISLETGAGANMRFTGFSNYKRILADKVFLQSIGNTFLYLIIQVPIMLVLAILLAQMLNNKDLKLKGLFRTCVFLPCATSLVSYSLIFRSMFATDGLINSILIKLGILSSGYNFLGHSASAKAVIILALVWRWTGYNMVFYLSGLQNIEYSVYEAAKIDGANGWKTFWKITVPLLKPTIIMTVIMSINGTLQLFDESVNLTKGGPANTTITMSHYIYNTCFINVPNFGYAAAMSFIIFIMVAVLAFINLKVGDTRD